MVQTLSENASKILAFLEDNPNVDIDNGTLAESLGLDKRVTVGTVNGLVKKGLVFRESVVHGGDTVKYIRLTQAGESYEQGE